MPSAHRNVQPQNPYLPLAPVTDAVSEALWPTAQRALLLLSEAVSLGDPLLARLSDEDLSLLRASLSLLTSSEPTSAA